MRTATQADLRTAYLKLARANHPDRFDGRERARAEARMQEINQAWNVVGVAHKRSEYDNSLPDEPVGASNGSRHGQRGRTHFKPFDEDPVSRVDIDYDTTPIAGSRAIPRWMSFAPVLFVLSGVLSFGFGMLVKSTGIVAFAASFVVLGLVSFLLLPLIVMSRAERDPDL